MTRAQFIKQILPILERVYESAWGIEDGLEQAIDEAVQEIANVLPQTVFEDVQ